MKECAYCAAEVGNAAIVCGLCGRELVSATKVATSAPAKTPLAATVFAVIVVALLVLLAIGLGVL
jgi:hypothetical protein